MSDYEPLATRLKKLAKEAGISGDELIEKARDADRDGYAFTTLREMLYGKRSLQLRAIIAFAKALDKPVEDFPEYRLTLVRYLTDEQIQGTKIALANFNSLEINYLPELSEKQVQAIPISHRKSTRARKTKQRTSGG